MHHKRHYRYLLRMIIILAILIGAYVVYASTTLPVEEVTQPVL